MVRNRFLGNVSANTLQLVINQVFGLIIFLALSNGLDKNIFGQMNWVFAVLLTIYALLSFGIDQVVVRRIAAGEDRHSLLSSYIFHVVITGGFFYSLVLFQYFFFPGLFPQQFFLLCLGMGKLFIFFSTPFKQLVVGAEKFSLFMFMSVVSNIVRGTGLIICWMFDMLSVIPIVILFVAGDLAELIACIIISKQALGSKFTFRFNTSLYSMLVKESLPQAGVVILKAVMARFDWIIIGILVSSIKLAEYSFAWKLFEVFTFPLLIIAPLMLPLFTRMLKLRGDVAGISFFLEWQIIIASFIALIINMTWVPVIDLLTQGKYGLINATTIFILSLSMPLLYFNNYLWTLNFAAGKLKLVFNIIAISFVINIIACLVLIPLYAGEGAAIAFFLTSCIQFILYFLKTPGFITGKKLISLSVWPLLALVTGYAGKEIFPVSSISTLTSILFFLLIVFMCKPIKQKDLQTFQAVY